MDFSINDRVIVVDPSYCCAECGTIGTIVNEGYFDTVIKQWRFLVAWDGNESMLFGAYSSSIKKLDY